MGLSRDILSPLKMPPRETGLKSSSNAMNVKRPGKSKEIISGGRLGSVAANAVLRDGESSELLELSKAAAVDFDFLLLCNAQTRAFLSVCWVRFVAFRLMNVRESFGPLHLIPALQHRRHSGLLRSHLLFSALTQSLSVSL